MPELPEVETVVRQLRPRVVGRTILRAAVYWERSVGDRPTFLRHVRGRTVGALSRRAKYILVELDRGVLVGHLRMSGRMHVHAAGFEPRSHTRVCLHLDDGAVFEFHDVRKFGRLLYARRAEDVLPPLGPEPLGDAFTAAWLRAALATRQRQIKPLLLDQSFVAGLGNIYVDEALYAARLHPRHPAHRIGRRKAEALHTAIHGILLDAIRRNGSSFDAAFRTPEGLPGDHQHQLQVYGRGGEPCRRCGAPIRKLLVGQRGTHVCPRCQRSPAVSR